MQSDRHIEPLFVGPLNIWTFPLAQQGFEVCVRRFDIGSYEPSAFARAGIFCPETVSRSVLKRQAEFLCGRIVARDAMRHLGKETWRERIDIGPSRQPQWPQGVTGSISHSGDFAAAIAARAIRHQALGLDIEQVISGDTLDAISAIAVDTDEQSLLKRASGSRGFEEALTLAFSAKESLFKAAFPSVGRFFDFDAARVTAFDPEGRLTLTLIEDLGGDYHLGRRFDIQFACPTKGLIVTLCAPATGAAD